jgi:LemA protein
MPQIALIVILVAIVLYVVSIYNSLQTIKTQIAASIQEIGNQLKRQASLIPNLQESVKAYMGHEKGIFQMLTDARTLSAKAQASNNAADIDKAIDKIQSVVPAINVLVESNPEIKADATVGKFMDELTDTADKLMYARRSLIDLSQSYNQKLMVFPSNIVANTFGFKPEKGLGVAMQGAHLEVSDAETQDVKVNLKS